MSLYSLSYDLRNTRHYPKLTEELETNFGAVRVLGSVWYFRRYSTTSIELCEHFRNFIDHDDGLIVSEISDWASVGVSVPMPE